MLFIFSIIFIKERFLQFIHPSNDSDGVSIISTKNFGSLDTHNIPITERNVNDKSFIFLTAWTSIVVAGRMRLTLEIYPHRTSYLSLHDKHIRES